MGKVRNTAEGDTAHACVPSYVAPTWGREDGTPNLLDVPTSSGISDTYISGKSDTLTLVS